MDNQSNNQSDNQLTIRLFGRFEAHIGGEPLWKTPTQEEKLLAFLTERFEFPVSYDEIRLEILELSDKHASADQLVRESLSRLVDILGASHQWRLPDDKPGDHEGRGCGECIQFHVFGADIDVARFHRLSDSDTIEDLRECLNLYAPLLEEWAAPWVREARTRWEERFNALKERYLGLLDERVAGAKLAGRLDEAIELLQQAVEADPFDQPRVFDLVKLLVSQNLPVEGLRVFDAFASRLYSEKDSSYK